MSLNLFFDIPKEEDDEDFNDYLIHSYLYYKLDTPIIFDYDFDLLCKTILSKWKTLNHKYKHLVKVEDLKAGTGYNITKYPKDIIEEAERRKEIFLSDLQSEVLLAKQYEEEKKEELKEFNFTNAPGETYFLCGLYRDLKMAGRRHEVEKEKSLKVLEELKKRSKEEINKYCQDWEISPEIFS